MAVIHTKGNPYTHIVLRGGSKGTNYDSVHIELTEQALEKAAVAKNIMIDCSHANSSKKPELQPNVMDDISNQILGGNQSIVGLMIESNINEGNQSIPADLSELKYGVSVTDGCINWDTTAKALRAMREKLKDTLPGRRS